MCLNPRPPWCLWTCIPRQEDEAACESEGWYWNFESSAGISEPGELHTLPELGLSTIQLDYKLSKRTDRYGNLFMFRAKVSDLNGAQLGRWAWDVVLHHAP